jgi:hypothetical protein
VPRLVGIETLAGDLGHVDDFLNPCAEDPGDTPAADCKIHMGIDADHGIAAAVAAAAAAADRGIAAVAADAPVAAGLFLVAADHDIAAAVAAAGHGSRNPALTTEDQ